MIARTTLALAVATSVLAGGVANFAGATDFSRTDARPLTAAVRRPGTIVYGLRVSGRADGFYTIAPGGRGIRRLPLSAGECLDCLSVSADGKRILFAAKTVDKRVAVATANLDGTDHRVFRLPDATLNLDPGIGGVWSPDGRRVALEGWDRSGARNGLYTSDSTDGSKLRRLTSSGHVKHDLPLGYSPDGARILMLRTADSEHAGSLYVVKADGSGLRQLNPRGTNVTAPFGSPASWSPDGGTIAFSAFSDSGNGRSAVFTVGSRGQHLRRITPWAQWTTSARWSPNGHWIAYDTLRSDLPAHDLFIMRPDGTDVRDILVATPGLGSCCAVWSPDSRNLLFQRGDQRLWTVAVDGSEPVRLTKTAGEYAAYAWAP